MLVFPGLGMLTKQYLESIEKFRPTNLVLYCESFEIKGEFGERVHEISVRQRPGEIQVSNQEERVLQGIANKYWRNERKGNDYLRVAGLRILDKARGKLQYQTVEILLSPTRWGFMKLRENIVAEGKLKELDATEQAFVSRLSEKHILNGLGVRTFVFSSDGFILLQRRGPNNTYPHKLEATASGYLDSRNPSHYRDGRFSVTAAAEVEIEEEIGISSAELRFENVGVLGMTRNDVTGHLDVFSYFLSTRKRDYLEEVLSPSDRVEGHLWLDSLPGGRNSAVGLLRKAAENRFEEWVPQAPASLAIVLSYVLPIFHTNFEEKREVL